MLTRRLLPLIAAGLFAAACQTVVAGDDQPARIVNADTESRAALHAAVGKALGTDVLLAQDALTDSSVLTVERWPAGRLDNPVPQGRIVEPPIRFQLMRRGDACVLIRLDDGARYVLADTDCAVE